MKSPFSMFRVCKVGVKRWDRVNLLDRRVLWRWSSSSGASAAEPSSEIEPETQTHRFDHGGSQLTNSQGELCCSFLISAHSTFTCSYFLFKWSLTNICTGNYVTTVFLFVLNDRWRPIFYVFVHVVVMPTLIVCILTTFTKCLSRDSSINIILCNHHISGRQTTNGANNFSCIENEKKKMKKRRWRTWVMAEWM